MTFFLRALTLAMLLASPVVAADPSADPWPLTAPGLPPDPAILFGTLPNGMRYLILHNPVPAHGVSLRLLVAAGSIYEKDDEEGIAHFIEHMTFRGTTHVADGEEMRTLQTLGLSPAADADAFTGSDQTKYDFDLPRNDPATIDTGLMLLRETAAEALFDPKALDSERPVILAEGRTRDSGNSRLDTIVRQTLYGTRLSDALTPIGKIDVVQQATPALLRHFYHAYYRPERTVLIVVGDIDPKMMEERIRAHFADWKAVGRAGRAPDYTPPAHQANEVHLIGNVPSGLYLEWMSPFDPAPDGTARDLRTMQQQVGLAIFNDRLAALARHPNPPFLEAQVSVSNRKYQGHEVTIFAAPGAAMPAASLAAIENLHRDLLQNGVRQSEVDEKIAAYRTYFQTALDQASSIPSPVRANALLDDVANSLIISSTERDRSLLEEFAPSVNAASVSAALRALFTGQGPVLIAATNQQPGPHAQDDITKLLTSQANAPVIASSQPDAPVVWPYASFGNPGRVVSRKTIDDLGITRLRFANGVTAMIKPTKFRTGQILLELRMGQGQIGLSPKQLAAAWLLANSYMGGGLAKISNDDMQHVFAGRVAQVTMTMEPDSYIMHGATRPQDLAIQLQVMAAFLTDAAWRPEALQRARVSLFSALANARATPDGALDLAAASVLHGGDPRWQTPAFGPLLAVTPADLKALLQPALDGPLSVAIVGDVDPATAENLLAATLGALPRRQSATPLKGDESLPQPSPSPIVLYHGGPVDQSVAAIGWPAPSYFPDMQAARTAELLGSVISTRLFDELRTHDGMTYTPQLGVSSSLVTNGYGYVYSFADVPPMRIGDYYAAMEKVVADLRATPISGAELQRALEPRLEAIAQQRQTNEYWLSEISGALGNENRFALTRNLVDDTKTITPADLQKLAQTYLTDDKMFRIVVLPKGYTLPAYGIR